MLFVGVQPLSRARLFVTPRTAARQASLSLSISRSLLKLVSIESVMPSHHLHCMYGQHLAYPFILDCFTLRLFLLLAIVDNAAVENSTAILQKINQMTM